MKKILFLVLLLVRVDFLYSKNCDLSKIENFNIINSSPILKMQTPEDWLKIKTSDRKNRIEFLAAKIIKLCDMPNYVIVVSTDYYSELWLIRNTSATLIDSISSFEISLGEKNASYGNWFGSFNIRHLSGDYPASGFNIRAGRMLYRKEYDIAINYDYLKYKDADSSSKSLGLSLRRYMTLTQHTGFNFGFKLERNDYTGKWKTDLSALVGLNFYLPGGSFDISLNLGEGGRRGINIGYTIFLGK